MIKRGNKLGLSTIVATLIIILLVLVAVGIIWVVIQKVVKGGSEQVSLGKFTLDLKILQVKKINDSEINVTVKRNPGAGDLVGINFLIENDEGDRENFRVNTSFNELEVKTFNLNELKTNASKIKKILIIPIFRLSLGTEELGIVNDEYKVASINSVTGEVEPEVEETICGNGIIDSGETCDDGNTISGDGCSSTCQIENSYTCNGQPSVCTLLCGNEICDGTENCATCPGDCSCPSGQECSSGTCTACITHASSNCSGGDVYWWNSCGQREEIRYDCNSTQTCSGGVCVNNPTPPIIGSAIIANHNAARDFDIIPECWLQKARIEISLAYQHTSHGSQIPSGMDYLRTYINPTLYAYSGSNVTNSLYFRDNVISGSGGYTALDLGYGYWDEATSAYLDTNLNMNTIMWSWCGQVSGYTTYSSMNSHYLSPAEAIVDNYNINLIYMTGHLDGTGPTGNVYVANNIIRQHVQDVNGILFDFADIESYDPDGNYYPGETDACNWCTIWCTNHPEDCVNLPSCAHSHGFNCVQKGRAYWWMMARMVGWDGIAYDACP